MTTKIEEINGIMLGVQILMHVDYRLRDNDYLLYKAFEAIENGSIRIGSCFWKRRVIKYVNKLEKNLGTPPDTISRTRRIIQYEKGLLLGDRAIARKAAAEQLRNDIKDL